MPEALKAGILVVVKAAKGRRSRGKQNGGRRLIPVWRRPTFPSSGDALPISSPFPKELGMVPRKLTATSGRMIVEKISLAFSPIRFQS